MKVRKTHKGSQRLWKLSWISGKLLASIEDISFQDMMSSFQLNCIVAKKRKLMWFLCFYCITSQYDKTSNFIAKNRNPKHTHKNSEDGKKIWKNLEY